MVKTEEGCTEIRRLRARLEAQEEKIDDLTQLVQTLSEKKQSNLFVSELKHLAFRGDNPRRWLSNVEIYFSVNKTPAAMKVILAQICMEGPAENWYDILLGIYPQITWSEFKEEVVARFTGEESHYQGLFELRQQGTVDEYLEKFETIAVMIPKLTENDYIDYFRSGLRDEVKYEVFKYWKPEKASAREIVGLARRVESANDLIRKRRRQWRN